MIAFRRYLLADVLRAPDDGAGAADGSDIVKIPPGAEIRAAENKTRTISSTYCVAGNRRIANARQIQRPDA